MALSNNTKKSLIELLFGAAKVAVKSGSGKAPAAEPEKKPVAQNPNLSGCCDKKKVK